MTNRQTMLDRIRAAVAAGNADTAPGPIPRRYHLTGPNEPGAPEVIELLIDRLLDYKAEVDQCVPADVAAKVAAMLRGAATVVIPPELGDDVQAGCQQSGAVVATDGNPEALTPTALDRVEVVVTAARVAIAVTGTIILDAAPDQGRRAISLVPDRHIIVLRANQVVGTVPEGLTHLNPTAPLTLISGPSATSDIELERVEGVHGPRTLQVLIVGP